MKDHADYLVVVPDWTSEFLTLLTDRKSRRLLAREDGPRLFAGFTLIVLAASKAPIRGVLMDFDGVITPADLAADTGADEDLFSEVIDLLSDQRAAQAGLCLLDQYYVRVVGGSFVLPEGIPQQLSVRMRRVFTTA